MNFANSRVAIPREHPRSAVPLLAQQVDPSYAETLIRAGGVRSLDTLTGRERDVLALMAQGLSDRGIAARLWVSLATVNTHVQSVYRKMCIPDTVSDNRRVGAVLAYLQQRS